MGEAKRRKQRDVSYGQFYQVRTTEDIERHVEKLSKDFSKKWHENLEATNGNLDEVTARLADRMQKELSCYKAADRQVLTTGLINMYAGEGEDYLEMVLKQDDAEDQAIVLIMFMECLLKVLKPWLDENQKREVNNLLAQLQG
jgi:hypothetical protein